MFPLVFLMSADDCDGLRKVGDEDLVAKFKKTRGPEYFAEIFRRYKRSVFRLCYSVVKDPAVAEDATQEAFVKAYSHIDSVGSGSFSAWLFATGRNACLNYLNSAGHKYRVSDADLSAIADFRQPDLEISLGVESVLNLLPLQQRVVMKLRYIDGLSYKEIAEGTGFDDKAVKTYLQNGLRNFKKRWNAGNR